MPRGLPPSDKLKARVDKNIGIYEKQREARNWAMSKGDKAAEAAAQKKMQAALNEADKLGKGAGTAHFNRMRKK